MATLLVFTFVALWHDLSFKLLAWGWLVSLFILPELIARRIVPYDKVSTLGLDYCILMMSSMVTDPGIDISRLSEE